MATKVYRHLLYNRLGRTDNKLDPSILRLGILLVLFDVYITWARIERSNTSLSGAEHGEGGGPEWALANAPIITQYLFFLTMNVLATVAQHASIRFLSRYLMDRFDKRQPGDPSSDETVSGRASPSAISTALLVSSCTKLFPILLVIWPTANSDSSEPDSEASLGRGLGKAFVSNASNYVGWVVLLNNIEALLILLDCGYVVATGLALTGLMFRQTVEGMALAMVGLRGTASPEAVSQGLQMLQRSLSWCGWG
ncbi:Protein arv1 [Cyphellophora attinorum]|uniref:Protein ARV n=1 Tax=Cyphellophora attinorum TaxID=1664694 RepID=A0A0N1NWE8_9EURO|nr:Protein arv1 [Phialophora attinorum]KPI35452.1 Protein arv1 [Phialophora attinorum]